MSQIDHIVTIDVPSEEKFLRKKTTDFTVSGKGIFSHGEKTFTKPEIQELLLRMKKTMIHANGIGLSANQIGLPYQLFVARVQDQNGSYKFYAVFNPKIEKLGEEEEESEEGCLSIPGAYGSVSRPDKITITGLDKSGKALKLKAWGLLARVFQHEIDHLNGKLFIDRATDIHRIPTSDRLKNKTQEES